MKLAVPLVADLEDAVTYDLIAPPEILKPEGLLDAVWDGIAKKYIEDFRSATQAAINAEYALTGNGGANGVSWIRIYPTSLIRDYATVLSRALIEELETSISN